MSYAEVLRILNTSTQFITEDISSDLQEYYSLLHAAEARYALEKERNDKPWDIVGHETQNFYMRIILSEKRNIDVDVDSRFIQ